MKGFENQDELHKCNKNKDSKLESVKQSAGLAERGEAVSRELVPASFSEACQEKVSGISV